MGPYLLVFILCAAIGLGVTAYQTVTMKLDDGTGWAALLIMLIGFGVLFTGMYVTEKEKPHCSTCGQVILHPCPDCGFGLEHPVKGRQ